MTFPILAHGNLGFLDELIPIVASGILLVLFLALLLRGRGFAPELVDEDDEKRRTDSDV